MTDSPQLRFRGAGRTDVGQRRKFNEDAFLVDDALGIYVVADGMGGHAAGDVASQLAVESVHNFIAREKDVFERVRAGQHDGETMQRALRVVESAVQAATYMIFATAEHEPKQRGMGTTVSVLVACNDLAITGQVGDSRIYRVRGGEVTPLTEDHTLVAWQIRQGVITKEEAAKSPHRNVITRAVGSRDYVQVDTALVDVYAGDRFLVCSDGLHGYLSDDHELIELCGAEIDEAAQAFINLANQRGGKDNITAILVQAN